ncbi:MAG: beta-galactosidase [Firmicutes bacterium]|nr:beta-galactosidase [Bacillota bacterium]
MKDMPHILHGGDYNPEQWLKWKDEIWPEDMRLAKEAGINTLSIGIFSWSMLEVEEDVFDFSWLDEVMDMLAQNGLKAVLATPTGARPQWMAERHTEVLRVEKNGIRNQYGGRHNACLSSPYFRRKVTQINTMLAERYKDHPALGMWHISNEYGGSGDSACYCPYCQERFRTFLKNKYQTLDALNEAYWTTFWSHRYTSWSQVVPPMNNGETMLHGLNLDWHRFTTWQYIDFYRLETEPLKRITPGVKCTANLMELFYNINYFEFAKELDVVSWDNYPRWRNNDKDIDVATNTAFVHDMFRSMKGGQPFLLMESCPSAPNWHPVAKIYANGAHFSHSLQAVAHGSDSVQYFQFRKSRGSSEKFHGAVVDHEGHGRTRVFQEIADTGRQLKKLDAIVGTRVPARAAILFDWENWWAYDDAQFGHNDAKDYVEMVREYYRPLHDMGIPVDIIDQSMDLSGYRLVITPYLYLLRPGFADKLKAFVRSGGTWVATCINGYVNETDLCYLGGFPGELKETLGIWEEELDSLYEDDQNEIIWKGKPYKAWHYCALSHVLDDSVKVEAVYEKDFYRGYPALTRRSEGLGQALYVAARMEEAFLHDFLSDLTNELALPRILDAAIPHGLEVTLREDGESEYVFLNNFSHQPVTIDLGEGGTSLLSGETLAHSVTIPERGVEIFSRPAKP